MFEIVPSTRHQSLFYQKDKSFEIADEYSNFLDKYIDGNILVAFGRTWSPRKQQYTELISAFSQMPNIGFIISLSPEWQSYQAIKEANLSNVLLKTFVPQKELLKDDRVKALISHCGANSIMEAIYYGQPIIGMPIAWD